MVKLNTPRDPMKMVGLSGWIRGPSDAMKHIGFE
jgi:hypothetical protein